MSARPAPVHWKPAPVPAAHLLVALWIAARRSARHRARTGVVRIPALAAVLLLTLLPAAPAGAHVMVDGESAITGGYTVLTFRVPTESADAATTAVTVHLPSDTPFTSVRTKPVPGWAVELVESDLPAPVEVTSGATVERAVSEIRWTADGGGLGPGEFGEFEVSLGPLPDPGIVHFPVVQGYSDGTTADWVQQAESGVEAQYPAPSLEVVAEGAPSDEHGAVPADDAADEGTVDEGTVDEGTASAVPAAGHGTEAGSPDADPLPRLLGGLALAVAAVAAVLAGAALRRRR